MPQQKTHNKTGAARRGVTLVEIAIVLVIIGLLLGGVLKGQELINNAKIRNIADRQVSLKVAWFAFIGKYGAPPGDYVFAQRDIPGGADGDGVTYFPGDGEISVVESPIVLQNLTGAGFLRCPQCTATTATTNLSGDNSLQNSYGGVMAIFTNNLRIVLRGTPHYGPITYATIGTGAPRIMSHSGAGIPSNIAAEVDRKIDDGIANTGDLVFNNWSFHSHVAIPIQCMSTAAEKQADPMDMRFANRVFWRHASAPAIQSCGFSVHF